MNIELEMQKMKQLIIQLRSYIMIDTLEEYSKGKILYNKFIRKTKRKLKKTRQIAHHQNGELDRNEVEMGLTDDNDSLAEESDDGNEEKFFDLE